MQNNNQTATEYDQPEESHHTNEGEAEPTELSFQEYNNFLLEIREQPAWRRQANIEDDYYDGKQLDNETLSAMQELGMAPIVENIMAPTIDAVIGLEAKTRRDWHVTAESDEEIAPVAEAMNMKLNEAEKRTRADRAISDAFSHQVRSGLGFVEVGREHDPFEYPYRTEFVHRNEIFFDMRDQSAGLTKSRFLIRKKWHDTDQIMLAFPQHKDILQHLNAGISGFDRLESMFAESTGLNFQYGEEAALSIDEQEWRNVHRSRLCLHEVWYRRWIKGLVFTTPDGRTVEFDKKNPIHVQAVGMGKIQPRQAIFSKTRLSWWIGAVKLADIANPYKHNKFPYVPFFGKRESMTGVPYGLGRPMKSMQDEVNSRNTKMHWLLTAKRVIMTEGVTIDDEDTVRQEAGRPDAMHVLDPEAMRNGGVFKIESDFQLNAQQYQTLVDKRQSIKNVAGVYSAFEGSSENMSGVAINSLAEQSSQTLAEIYDNLAYSRMLVGEMLMSLIIQDMGKSPQKIVVKSEFEAPRTVMLNTPTEENGIKYLDNDLQRAQLKVSLADVPTTASYRAQRLQTLTQIQQALPEQYQALILDFVMAATDEPDRAKIVKRIRKATGMGEDEPPKTQEEAQQRQVEQQAAAEQAQLMQKDQMLTLQEKEAKINKMAAETEKIRADAANGNDNSGQIEQLKADMAMEGYRKQFEELFNQAVKKFDTTALELESKKSTAIQVANIDAAAKIEISKNQNANRPQSQTES